MLFKSLSGELSAKNLRPWDRPGLMPVVSVVVPARDEEHNIKMTVSSILDSDWRKLEVILVDDRSVDNTRKIMDRLAAEDSRIHVTSVEHLPVDWTGKTHALLQGVKRATSDIFVFTDADCVWSSDVLSRSLQLFLSGHLDMLSLLPSFTKRGFNEIVVHPHLALGFSSFFPLSDVNHPGKTAAIASGCFIMLRRGAYHEIGTWKHFRNEITEDVAMSRALKAGGFSLRVIRGEGLVRTKPFGNLKNLTNFWRRTLYGGLEKSLARIIRLSSNYISLFSLYVLLVVAVWDVASGNPTGPKLVLLGLSALTTAAVVVPFAIFLRRENIHPLYALTVPVGLAISAFITLSTLGAVITGTGIKWRDSVYQ